MLSHKEWHKKAECFDIFINTTNIDNTPVSVLEAMALGLPVVSTDVGGIKYIIKHKENGLLVTKNDVDGMVNSIKDIIDGQYNDIPINAREKLSYYESENVINMWNNILV